MSQTSRSAASNSHANAGDVVPSSQGSSQEVAETDASPSATGVIPSMPAAKSISEPPSVVGTPASTLGSLAAPADQASSTPHHGGSLAPLDESGLASPSDIESSFDSDVTVSVPFNQSSHGEAAQASPSSTVPATPEPPSPEPAPSSPGSLVMEIEESDDFFVIPQDHIDVLLTILHEHGPGTTFVKRAIYLVLGQQGKFLYPDMDSVSFIIDNVVSALSIIINCNSVDFPKVDSPRGEALLLDLLTARSLLLDPSDQVHIHEALVEIERDARTVFDKIYDSTAEYIALYKSTASAPSKFLPAVDRSPECYNSSSRVDMIIRPTHFAVRVIIAIFCFIDAGSDKRLSEAFLPGAFEHTFRALQDDEEGDKRAPLQAEDWYLFITGTREQPEHLIIPSFFEHGQEAVFNRRTADLIAMRLMMCPRSPLAHSLSYAITMISKDEKTRSAFIDVLQSKNRAASFEDCFQASIAPLRWQQGGCLCGKSLCPSMPHRWPLQLRDHRQGLQEYRVADFESHLSVNLLCLPIRRRRGYV